MTVTSMISRLGKTVTIKRKAVTFDDCGSYIDTFSSHLTSVKAAIFPISQSDIMESGRDHTVGMATVYVTMGQDIVVGDELEWVDGSTTRSYQITGVTTMAELAVSDHMAGMVLSCEEQG